MLADIPFLRRLMEQVYAGYADLLRHPEFDPGTFWEEWTTRVRGTSPVATGGSVTLGEAVAPLAALQRLVPDTHFYVGAEWSTRGEGYAVAEFQAPLPPGLHLDRVDLAAVPGALPCTFRVAPLLRADGALAQVVAVSAATPAAAVTLRCGAVALTLARRAATPLPALRPPQVPAYEWRVAGDAAIVTLRRFGGPAVVREQLSHLSADYPEHARHPTILFDLSGNGGGSLEHIHRWIAQAKRGPWRTYPRLEVTGALWPCAEWNLIVERQVREWTVDTPAAHVERDRLRAARPPHRPVQTSTLDAGYREDRAEHPYGGRVYVLVDRHSGSSGELAAVPLQRALGAVVIGERTAGTMQYGEIRRFVLPHTGLICQVPTKRFFFDHAVERVGWPVDVYLEDVTQDAGAIASHLHRLPVLR